MPTYEYACRNCGHHVEVVQKFSDAPLQTCEVCQGQLRKVFSAAGIIFKGSGYYVTDNRKGGGDGAKSPAPASSDAGKSDSGSSSESSSSSSDSGSSSSTSSSTSSSESKSA